MILYFDTETTGLVPGRIIELSYILQYRDHTIAKNFFFAVDYIPKEATAVHGFTTEKLAILSEGKTFSDYAEEIYNDFKNAELIVAHNANFDINFLIAEFSYLDLQFRYKESFDTMKYFTNIIRIPRSNHKGYKYPKLGELMNYMEIFPYDITRKVDEFYNTYNIGFHDARYDTVGLYLAFNYQADRDDILSEIKVKSLDK